MSASLGTNIPITLNFTGIQGIGQNSLYYFAIDTTSGNFFRGAVAFSNGTNFNQEAAATGGAWLKNFVQPGLLIIGANSRLALCAGGITNV